MSSLHSLLRAVARIPTRCLSIPVFAFCLCLAVQTAAVGHELRMAWNADVGPSNPHMYQPSQMFAQDLIYEGLVNYGPGGRIEPHLAESWALSEDGRELTFVLRRDVVFSDGTPFDAKAVLLNVEHVLANRERHAWMEFIRQMDKVDAVDSHTVRFSLKQPYSGSLQELSLIRPLRFLSPSGFRETGITRDGIKAPIGTGRWIMSEYRKDEYAVFLRNDRYWGTKPTLSRVVVRVMPDVETRLLALERGDIDLLFGDGLVGLEAFVRLRQNRSVETFVSGPLFTRIVQLNTSRPLLADIKVRQAILSAVDKDSIVKSLLLDLEPRADGLFSPGVPFTDVGLPPVPYDPGKTRALLEEAGWRLTPGQGIRTRSGERLALTLAFAAPNTVAKGLAEVLQAYLRAVGIELRLHGEDPAATMRRQRAGDFDLMYGDSWGPPYEPAAFINTMRSPTQPSAIAQTGLPMKADIDRVIASAMAATSEERQREMYRILLTTFHEQAIHLPISHAVNLAVLRRDFTGFGFAEQQYVIPLERIRRR